MSKPFAPFHSNLIVRVLANKSLAEIVQQDRIDEEHLKAAAEEKIITSPIRINSPAEQTLFKTFIKGFVNTHSFIHFVFQFKLFFTVFLFTAARPNIESIDLSHSVFLTDDLVFYLVKSCPNIKVLRIWNCLSLNDPGFYFFYLCTISFIYVSHVIFSSHSHFTTEEFNCFTCW